MPERLQRTPGPLTVAVIEDDPDHALLASEALEERGHRVILFGTAGAAFDAYRPRVWDVIVLDYRLPDMNGLQALERLLAMPGTPPVVMVTASGGETIAVAALKKGARDYVVKTGTHGQDLAQAAEMAVVEHHIQQMLAIRRREIERRATTDALTGLLNRHRLADELRATALRAVERGEPYAVVMLDLNDFKRVNDTYGHAAGDLLLAAFADLLRRCTREGDVLARYGGDEFVIVMPGLNRDTCQPVISRITEALQPLHVPSYPDLQISVATGASDCSAGSPSEVLAAADRAMYRSKERVRV
ncbi:MAG: diguanylate cyclase [Armatimonadota bacterium]|nr:diguanylate cyclase [Armatimonadota bacterium]